MKINKNIKIFFNYFFAPLLFLWLGWSIYHQIRRQPDLIQSWRQIRETLEATGFYYLALVLVLMLCNWGLESYKWQLAVKQVQKVSILRANMAIFAGLAFSITTPNRIGEYAGRVLYLDEGNKIKAVSPTIVSSLSQLIITILMGLLALFFMHKKMIASGILSPIWYQTIFFSTFAGLGILTLFYFRLAWLVKIIDNLPAFRKYRWVLEALEKFDATLLLRFLSISAGRFAIFICQYFLLFHLFGVEVDFWQAWMTLSVMFLIMALIPTIALFTDLGLKNEISLKLLGLYSANHLGISLTSLSIWFINLVIPAIIGSLLILGIHKIFKNNYENA